MSTTTAADLLARADLLTRQVRRCTEPVTSEQWASFDTTIHRLLTEILGAHAGRVPIDDPHRPLLRTLLDSYPDPIHTTSAEPDPAHTVRTGSPRPTRTEPVRHNRRTLHLVTDQDPTPQASQAYPAGADDPHPLARLACTYGALADLLHQPETDRPLSHADGADLADLTARVLAATAVAARNTLQHSAFAITHRPALIGHYAEHALDNIGHRDAIPTRLTLAAAVTSGAQSLNQRLDHAIATWDTATRAELPGIVPSLDVLHALPSQSTHLYAVTANVLEHTTHPLTDDALQRIVDAGRAFAALQETWPRGLTTLTGPRHSFITASRELFETLEAVQANLASDHPTVNPEMAARSLTRATHAIAARLAETAYLPRRLVNSGVVFAPARTLHDTDPDRLTAKTKGRHIPVRHNDVARMIDAWERLPAAAKDVEQQLILSAGRDIAIGLIEPAL